MLHHALSLLTLFALVLGQATPAPVITNNQYGAEYSLKLNQGPGPLNGVFDFKAISKGILVGFNINGFKVSDDTTYTYHIHENPVPENGDCNATGEHFDPYHVGTTHICDPNQPDLCQLGDLSGKHGLIIVNASYPVYSTGYQDNFLSTTAGNIAFFGNLSIVVHRKRDGFRLQCGNFESTGQPMLTNGSTQTVGNWSTTSCDRTASTQLSTDSLTPNITASSSSDATSAVSAGTTPVRSGSTQHSSPARSTATSSTSPQSGNHGSGRLEASLIMLVLTAVIPAMFL